MIGSPVEIVDDMEKWFLNYGVDGFLVHPAYLPGGLNDFVDLVIPELQNRGLFRTITPRRARAQVAGPTRRCPLQWRQ